MITNISGPKANNWPTFVSIDKKGPNAPCQSPAALLFTPLALLQETQLQDNLALSVLLLANSSLLLGPRWPIVSSVFSLYIQASSFMSNWEWFPGSTVSIMVNTMVSTDPPWYSTVQYSTVQYSTVQCNIVQVMGSVPRSRKDTSNKYTAAQVSYWDSFIVVSFQLCPSVPGGVHLWWSVPIWKANW